ncbi:MAG: GDSL-type esterase/lipase family protein [Bacteroidales bacterium]|jgi:lysophospholipase L1-like esterase|nr:GDSL-type esterase/lipase family protein [Bacteroidales bacterium]
MKNYAITIVKLLALLIILTLSTNFSAYSQNNKYHTLYYQRASLFEHLPIDSDDIVFLGNSITHFGEWHELFDNPNIKNRGISGDIAQGVFDRLDPVINGKPAKIFLLIGINDVSHDVSADSIVCAIKKIAEKIIRTSPATKLYIQSVMPVNSSFNMFLKATTKGDVVKEINKKLQSLCMSNNITYIDIYSHLTAAGEEVLNPEYTNDGLHLMGKGYIKWAEAVKNYISE